MEKEKDINPIGFDISDNIIGLDKNSPSNIVDTQNPPTPGGGNEGYTDQEPIYPPDTSGMTAEEIVNNHLLSQREHRKFINERRTELAGQQALPLIGMAALAYLIFS